MTTTRARMLASLTDPDQRARAIAAWEAQDQVRATTDRVRYSDIQRGDVIVSDDGTHYPVESVRRTMPGVSSPTDLEFALTGQWRSFTFRASRLDSTNRLPRN